MNPKYLCLAATTLDELLLKVNGAADLGYTITAADSYVLKGVTLPEELTHYVWMERIITDIKPDVVVQRVVERVR